MPDIYLEAATSITALNLDENNITELPDEIGQFKLLSELFSICDNQLLSLPASVGNLVLLQRLRLSGNKLTNLPDTVSALTNLELLTVDHNRLTDIPRAYSTLTRLTELTFTDNDVRKIHPEMGLISSITSLGLQDNPLVVPSNEICARSTAEVVDFLGRIKISQLTGCLDLAALDLTTLMHQLHEATSARVVLFQNNNLTKLPEEIEKLSRIQELILDNNPINSLPDQIGKLATLQILSIDKMIGGMQKLPVTMEALYSLVVFKASDNGITALPNCFKYLKVGLTALRHPHRNNHNYDYNYDNHAVGDAFIHSFVRIPCSLTWLHSLLAYLACLSSIRDRLSILTLLIFLAYVVSTRV